MSIVIIDITLSLLEQRFCDDELAKFAPLKATEASQDVRSLLRIDATKRDATVVYRLPVMHDWANFPVSLQSFTKELENACKVNPDSAQYLLWSELHEFRLELLTKSDPRFSSNVLKVGKIQLSEMMSFLSKEDVLFEHAGAALFELPSDQHSDYFLRVGNLQSNHAFFSAVFFWLLPQLKDIQHIFCDTWSISTTGAIVAENLMTYRESQNKECKERVSWSFSPAYLPSSSLKVDLIQDALTLAELKFGKVLFLSSFYSSGRLEREIVSQTLDLGRRENVKLVAIYAVGKKRFKISNNILCNIKPLVKKRGLLGKKIKPAFDSDILKVSKISFFPDYRSVERRPLLVRDIEKDADFLDRYVGKSIFSTHRDGRNSVHFIDGSRRHHAFHVDLPALYAESSFRAALAHKMVGVPDFGCVLLDKTIGASALLKALCEIEPRHTQNAEVFHIDDWRNLRANETALDRVNSSGRHTLVVLPTIITGQTIGDVKRHLRETCAHSLDRVHFLVGLLRPGDAETMRNYTELADKYVGASSITVVEAVNIPNWGKIHCPWCLEQDRIERVISDRPLEEEDRLTLLTRQESLQQAAGDGLKGSDVFFSTQDDTRLPFYARSLFVDVAQETEQELDELAEINGLESSRRLQEIANNTSISEADLCFVVAVALQNWRLRVTGKSVTKLTVDAATVSNDDKFNEARLRAAIWRSLRPEELSLAVKVSKDFQNMCNRIFGSDEDENHRCLEREALLAFGPEIVLHFGSDLANWNWKSLKWLALK